jgi:hypothetical protein
MSLSGGDTSSSSTQPYIVQGPTVAAAQYAAQAQVSATQQAIQAAQQNTQYAVQSVMNEYSQAQQLLQPYQASGTQALGQLNYALGLPAMSPGAAPTAPTAPTLQQAEQAVESNNPNWLSDYEAQHVNPQTYAYNGAGANLLPGGGTWNGQPGTTIGANGQTVMAAGPSSTADVALYNLPQYANIVDPQILAQLGNQYLSNTLQPEYNTENQQYQQQQNTWNTENQVYNDYQQKGQATSADLSNLITNLPGFQFQQQQGINQIQNAASASGELNSGNLLQSLNQFGQQLSSTYYQNYLSNLAQEAGMGAGASTTGAQGAQQTGAGVSGLQANLGTDVANSYLAAGQAMASSFLSPAANQQVMMYPYTTSSSSSSGGLSGSLGGLLSGASALSKL